LDIRELEQKNDEEIVEFVPQDKDVFGVLIRRYEEKLIRYVRRIGGGNRESIEDVVQNIFIKAYVNINSFKKDKKFSGWIYRIAHNECIDHWRKTKKYLVNISIEENVKLVSILSDNSDVAEEISSADDSESIRRALGKLPLKYKEILVLRFLEDKSYEEIGEILKKPVSTVGVILRRAKQKFKNILIQDNESR